MRVAAKRRADWRILGQVEAAAHEAILVGGGVAEVVRLGAGEPVVLVPGLAGGWRLLAPLALRLAQHHEVYLYNLRGDRSQLLAPRARSLSAYADDLAILIEQFRLERPTVFGISFGAAVALELAAERPERIGALVLQGGAARFPQSIGSTIARRVLERFPLPRDNGFVNQFFNLLHGGKPSPGPLARFVVESCWETDQSVMAQRLELLEDFDVTDRLWRLEMPTLVLAGTRDVIVPFSHQRALATAIPTARFTALENAGHIGFLTHRAEVVQQVRRLIRPRKRTLC